MRIERLARKGILRIHPYIPGKSIEEVQKEIGAKRWIKLASNENLLGPSAKAIAAIKKELPNIYLYPEGPCPVLRKALAEKFAISEGMVVISNGADNLLLMIANAFVNEGDEAVMADPTFSVYENVTRIMGGRPVKVKLKDFTHHLEGMLEKVSSRTKLVFICNPNNPTGTTVSRTEFADFVSELPAGVIVVLDEAYGDFAANAFGVNGLDFVMKAKQLIVLRTFSKVYGLAGLRIGYGLGRKDLIDYLYQVREPFPVHRLAQVAALAALKDEDHAARSIRLVQEGREYLYRNLESMGLFYVPSQANFVFIDFGRDSEEIFQAFLKEGIIIRPGKMWGYPTFARLTVGRRSDNRKFIKALKKILS